MESELNVVHSGKSVLGEQHVLTFHLESLFGVFESYEGLVLYYLPVPASHSTFETLVSLPKIQ